MTEPSDPTSYICNDFKMDKAIQYVKGLNESQKEVHVTMTHFITLAAAWGLNKMRRDVGRLPWGTFRAAKQLGVTILVDVDGGKDLVPVTLWDAHKMTVLDIAKKIGEKVQRAKKGKDDRHNKSTALANFIPSFISQPLGYALTYLSLNAGFNLDAFSIRNNSMGHLILTNVGTMGYTSAFAPLCPLLHALGYLCCGVIEKRAVVDKETDEIKVAHMMSMAATGDHRYGDAAIFLPFFKAFRSMLEDPENFDETKIKANMHYSELKDK